MKDFKSFIIGFLSCACVFLLMGQTYGDKHLVKTTKEKANYVQFDVEVDANGKHIYYLFDVFDNSLVEYG